MRLSVASNASPMMNAEEMFAEGLVGLARLMMDFSINIRSLMVRRSFSVTSLALRMPIVRMEIFALKRRLRTDRLATFVIR